MNLLNNRQYFVINIAFIIISFSLQKFNRWYTDFTSIGMLTVMALYNCGHEIKYNVSLLDDDSDDSYSEECINNNERYEKFFEEYNISIPTKDCSQFIHYSYKDINWYSYFDPDTKKYYSSRTNTFDKYIISEDTPEFSHGYIYAELGDEKTFIGKHDDVKNNDNIYMNVITGSINGFHYMKSYRNSKSYISYGDNDEFKQIIDKDSMKPIVYDNIHGAYKYKDNKFLVIEKDNNYWISNNVYPNEFYKISYPPTDDENASDIYSHIVNSQNYHH